MTQLKSLADLFPLPPFLSPENIRKPSVFLCFQGVEKRCIGNEWVNEDLALIVNHEYIIIMKCLYQTLLRSGSFVSANI